MAHHRRLLLEPLDHLDGVVGDLLEGLLGEDVRVRARLLDRLGVVGPIGGQCRVSLLLEVLDPVVPAARQQPEPVDEHNRRPVTRARLLDLLSFPLAYRHSPTPLCRLHARPYRGVNALSASRSATSGGTPRRSSERMSQATTAGAARIIASSLRLCTARTKVVSAPAP